MTELSHTDIPGPNMSARTNTAADRVPAIIEQCVQAVIDRETARARARLRQGMLNGDEDQARAGIVDRRGLPVRHRQSLVHLRPLGGMPGACGCEWARVRPLENYSQRFTDGRREIADLRKRMDLFQREMAEKMQQFTAKMDELVRKHQLATEKWVRADGARKRDRETGREHKRQRITEDNSPHGSARARSDGDQPEGEKSTWPRPAPSPARIPPEVVRLARYMAEPAVARL